MKQYHIETITGKVHSFIGEYLPEREERNWHYYEANPGTIFHFRKEHMVSVKEEDVPVFLQAYKDGEVDVMHNGASVKLYGKEETFKKFFNSLKEDDKRESST